MNQVPRNPIKELWTMLKVSTPTTIISMSRTLMGFVDFLFVAQLGTAAVAAITPAAISMWVVIGIGMGTMSIVGTFASQCVGRGERAQASAYLWQGLIASVIFGILSLLLWPLVEPVMRTFGHAPEVLELEIAYASWILLSVLPSAAGFALQSFFVGIHHAKVAMVAALVANAVNVLLVWLLVTGSYGFPKLGMAGAAIATSLASYTQLAVMLFFLFRKRYRIPFDTWGQMRFDVDKMRALLRIGFPAGLTWIFDILAWTVFTNFLVGRFGTAQLAASNICLQFIHLSFMPALGVGQALTAVVGKFIGEKNTAAAFRSTAIATRLCMMWMGMFGVIFWIFGEGLISFLDKDPEVAVIGVDMLRLAAVFQLFDALAIVYSHALRAAGDTFFATVVSFIANWGVFVGGGYLVTHYLPQWGANGPWCMATVMIIILGLIFRARFRSGRWQKINIFA